MLLLFATVIATATALLQENSPAKTSDLGPVVNYVKSLNETLDDPTTWLNLHNDKRKAYGVPTTLVWNDKLQRSAQIWANTLAATCTFQHSRGPYGENLAMGYSNIGGVMTAWVDQEAPYYNPGSHTCQGGLCGHFTQVLWRMSAYLGCAIARCTTGTPIFVCQYVRPGNCNGYNYQNTNSPCGPFEP